MTVSRKDFSIPVLMYHHVNPEGNFINVRPEIFENHVRYMKEYGYVPLNTGDLISIMRGEIDPPRKPVMITFDDGWLDNWVFAYPVLKKYGMKAVIFVITSWLAENGRRMRADEGTVKSLPVHKECQRLVDEKNSHEVMMSWDELKEMDSSGLIDIQSHSHTHQRWDRLYEDKRTAISILRNELETSRYLINTRLGKQCRALCWPWGRYDDSYIKTAKSSGYELMFTTEKGTNTLSTDPFRIKRIVIGNINLFSLRKKIFVHSNSWLSRVYLKYFK